MYNDLTKQEIHLLISSVRVQIDIISKLVREGTTEEIRTIAGKQMEEYGKIWKKLQVIYDNKK